MRKRQLCDLATHGVFRRSPCGIVQKVWFPQGMGKQRFIPQQRRHPKQRHEVTAHAFAHPRCIGNADVDPHRTRVGGSRRPDAHVRGAVHLNVTNGNTFRVQNIGLGERLAVQQVQLLLPAFHGPRLPERVQQL